MGGSQYQNRTKIGGRADAPTASTGQGEIRKNRKVDETYDINIFSMCVQKCTFTEKRVSYLHNPKMRSHKLAHGGHLALLELFHRRRAPATLIR